MRFSVFVKAVSIDLFYSWGLAVLPFGLRMFRRYLPTLAKDDKPLLFWAQLSHFGSFLNSEFKFYIALGIGHLHWAVRGVLHPTFPQIQNLLCTLLPDVAVQEHTGSVGSRR